MQYVLVSILMLWASASFAQEQAAPSQDPAPPPLPAAYKSVLFSDQELTLLKALEQKRKAQLLRGEDVPEVATTTEQAPTAQPASVTYEYPQFYLSMLAYNGPDRWIFRANGQNYTPVNRASAADFTIHKVEPAQVVLKYQASTDDPIDFSRPTQANVRLDPNTRSIWFALKPNQTFSTYTLKVYEGWVEPFIVDKRQANATLAPAPSVAEVFTPPASAPEPAAPSNQGLEGLMNRNKALENIQ